MSSCSDMQPCVLIIDEDVTFSLVLEDVLSLRLEQIEIDRCVSGNQALRQLAIHDYDVVISDITMPDMSRLELLKVIRYRHPEIPTLLVTGYQDFHFALQAFRQKVYDVIPKPVNWDYLITCVRSAIQTRQVRRWEQSFTQKDSWVKRSQLLSGLRVLIVDDDRDGREMQSLALRHFGAEVMSVSSVAAALAVYKEFEPHVVVSDIRMPVEDGYSLMRKLKRQSARTRAGVPAVAVTAYVEEEELRNALNAGFQLQLAKPTVPETLVLAVASLSGRILSEQQD